jgi:hypothetical protein
MKFCEQCHKTCPDHARFCMICGNALISAPPERGAEEVRNTRGWQVFWLTLGGSLVLSWLLVAVLHLPIFIIGAFLPLLWYSRN